MHVLIVSVPIVSTFVYMYEPQLVLQLIYYRVFLTDDVIGYPYDVIGGIPSLTIISFATDTNCNVITPYVMIMTCVEFNIYLL